MAWNRSSVRRGSWLVCVVAFGCPDDGDIVDGTGTGTSGSTGASTVPAMTTVPVDDGTSSTGAQDDSSSSSAQSGESGASGESTATSGSTGMDATTSSTSTGE